MAAPRNSGAPRCAYAQCLKIKRLARRVLYPAEMLVLLFCTVRKPALARVVRENFTRWGRCTYLPPEQCATFARSINLSRDFPAFLELSSVV